MNHILQRQIHLLEEYIQYLKECLPGKEISYSEWRIETKTDCPFCLFANRNCLMRCPGTILNLWENRPGYRCLTFEKNCYVLGRSFRGGALIAIDILKRALTN